MPAPTEDFGHHPLIPPRIGATAARLEEDVRERLLASVATDVSDAVGRLYTMDPGIRPLWHGAPRLVGPALTVKAVPGDNLAIHGALTRVQPGDVLVVDWQGYHEGCGSGVLSLVTPIERGLAGIVIDGAWRDLPEIAALGLPVFGRGESAFSPAKHQLGEINVPVCCGGVIVEPGDVIVADREGVAVIPRRHARAVAEALSPHDPKASLAEYPSEALAAGFEQRRRRYHDQYHSQGGVDPGG